MIFYWPDTKMGSSGYVSNTTSICNFPVQSLATADIIPIAVTLLWRKLKEYKCRSQIINTIHDSAPLKLHKDEAELVKGFIVESFTTGVYEYLKEVYGISFTAPLGVGIKIGTHWGTGEEIKIQVSPSI